MKTTTQIIENFLNTKMIASNDFSRLVLDGSITKYKWNEINDSFDTDFSKNESEVIAEYLNVEIDEIIELANDSENFED